MRNAIRLSLLSLLALSFIGIYPSESEAQRRRRRGRVQTNIIQTRSNVIFHVRSKGRWFRMLQARRVQLVARVWIRTPFRWKLLTREFIASKSWAKDFPKIRLCRRGYGKKRLALQLGVKYGNFWRNRWTRGWERQFVAVKQEETLLDCGPLPADMPPGSPPKNNAPQGGFELPPAPGQQPQNPPPAHPPHHNQPGHPHHHPPAQPPAQPPPPAIVPAPTFESFRRALKAASFDSRRNGMLKNWVNRLGRMKLSAGQVHRILKLYSFDKDRVTAGAIMSRHVLRPLHARQVAALMRTYSFDSYRSKAAMFYCRGLADPLNVHLIAAAFSFNNYKRQIMAACK